MTALAGALYCQYQMFISPDTVSGIAVSLQMVFAVVVGGIYVPLGPTVGAIITILLAEVLRIGFGTGAVGWDNLVYGVLLVLFIIFLPKGILGSLLDRVKGKPATGAGRKRRQIAERRRAAAHGERRQRLGLRCRTAASPAPAARPRPARRGPAVLGGLEQPRRHVQRVADIGDLGAHVADFAGDDLAAMHGGAELGHHAERAGGTARRWRR